MKKVFNLGFSKTGTTSIESALRILGYKVAVGHYNKNYCFYLLALCINRDYEEVLRFTDYYDAFCDGPWGGGTDLYKALLDGRPDAHFILSIREPESWYRSWLNQITLFDRNLETAMSSYHNNGMWGSAYWFRKVFDLKEVVGQEEKIKEIYCRYNDDVIAHFKSKGKELLVLDVTHGEPWGDLCAFLEHPVPKKPFPHTNVTEQDWEERRSSVIRDVQKHLFG